MTSDLTHADCESPGAEKDHETAKHLSPQQGNIRGAEESRICEPEMAAYTQILWIAAWSLSLQSGGFRDFAGFWGSVEADRATIPSWGAQQAPITL